MHGKSTAHNPYFLDGGGQMGALMRTYDWSLNPLGDPEFWPQALQTLVCVLLGSRQPMFIAWGSERIMLYNDGYAPMLGTRHPEALGQRFEAVWFDILDKVGPIMDRTYRGESVHMDDISFVMHRYGYAEETHFSFSYTPVRDESGRVRGMFCVCTETTEEVKARAALKSEKEHLQSLFQQAPGFMAVLRSPEHVFEFVNESYRRLVGDRDLIGKTVREAFPDLENQGFFELLDRAYATGEPFIGSNLRVLFRHRPGAPAHESFQDFVYQPITDDQGRVSGIFIEGYDVTKRKHAEDYLQQFRSLIEQSSDFIGMADLSGRVFFLNEGARQMLGSPEGHDWESVTVLDLLPPEDHDWMRDHVLPTLLNGEQWQGEARLRKLATGEDIPVWYNGFPVKNERGDIVALATVTRDITHQKQNEHRLKLLVNELNHRVRNTLATVQSLATQSFREVSRDSQSSFESFQDRLFALARAHGILTRENWEGAEIHEIVSEVIAPFENAEERRFRIEGPKVRLTPGTALSLSMAVHELAKNASRHGALTVLSGRVDVSWSVEGAPPHLSLRWQESGGPKVEPPTRKGFGTRLIERGLANELGGEVKLSYEPSGVICEVEAPLVKEDGPNRS